MVAPAWIRRVIRPGRSAGVGQVLLVAGPGGSGKSTLMALLADGKLPDDLKRMLPAVAESWPQITPRRKQVDQQLQHSALVLHYDFTSRFRHDKPYASDTVLQAVLQAKSLTVVDVHAPLERIEEQLRARSRSAEARRGIIRTQMRILRGKLRPRRVDAAGLSKLERYRQPGWLNRCYGTWERYLDQALAERGEGRLITLEPYTAPSGEPTFRVIRSRSFSTSADTKSAQQMPGETLEKKH